MRYLVTLMLVVVAIIHLLPLSGVLGGARLSVLYGLSFDDPNLAILMRHRAVLFGLLGAFLLYAAFRPGYQLASFVAGFVSELSSSIWLGRSVATTHRLVVCTPLTLWPSPVSLSAQQRMRICHARANDQLTRARHNLWAIINLNENSNAQSGAFSQSHNLNQLTLTQAATLIVPVFPPRC